MKHFAFMILRPIADVGGWLFKCPGSWVGLFEKMKRKKQQRLQHSVKKKQMQLVSSYKGGIQPVHQKWKEKGSYRQ